MQAKLITILPGRCWWCLAPADSAEHRFKRSDLVREHGRGGYHGDAVLSRITADGRWTAKSSKARVLTFAQSMCQRCNNERSQPFDAAYDEFIELVWASEERVIADRRLDLAALWGTAHATRGDDVLRFFVKHICCRVAELSTAEHPTQIPADLIAFLDGGPLPRSLQYEFLIEPMQLRMQEAWSDDPLGVRSFWLDPLFTTGPGGYSAGWRYGWLTFLWWVDVERAHPAQPLLRERALPMPLVATQFDVGFEFAIAAGVLRADGREEPNDSQALDANSDDRRRSKIADVTPNASLCATQYFLAGLLDTQSGLGGRVVDDRRNAFNGVVAPADPDAERARAHQLVSCAAVWAAGELDLAATRAAELQPKRSASALRVLAEALTAAAPSDNPAAALPFWFAAMSALRLAEAELAGLNEAEGSCSTLAVWLGHASRPPGTRRGRGAPCSGSRGRTRTSEARMPSLSRESSAPRRALVPAPAALNEGCGGTVICLPVGSSRTRVVAETCSSWWQCFYVDTASRVRSEKYSSVALRAARD